MNIDEIRKRHAAAGKTLSLAEAGVQHYIEDVGYLLERLALAEKACGYAWHRDECPFPMATCKCGFRETMTAWQAAVDAEKQG